ncbi:MAG: sensor histidine kinase [Anaerolineae bacterium]
MRLYAHLLAQTKLDPRAQEALGVINDQVAWLDHLIQDILAMTSLDSGQMLDSQTPIALPTVMDHLMARYESVAETRGLTLALEELPVAPPVVIGDQARLIRALSEIVDNAVQFTPPGGTVTLRVSHTEGPNHPWVTIAVADEGPGIPPEEQSRVFDRFFRGSIAESGHIPGTGVGLNIAQAIVEAHGGRIALSSSPAGTTFTVWLPARAPDEPAPQEASHARTT